MCVFPNTINIHIRVKLTLFLQKLKFFVRFLICYYNIRNYLCIYNKDLFFCPTLYFVA